MKAHFEKQPHFENEGSFRNTFWKWKHVFGTLFYCWNLNNIKYCKNQNQTTSKSECSYQLSNLIYLFNYFKRPGLFLTYLLTNTHSYLSNVIYGSSLTLLRQGLSNLSGDLQGKLFEGFSLYGLRFPHWVQLISERVFLFSHQILRSIHIYDPSKLTLSSHQHTPAEAKILCDILGWIDCATYQANFFRPVIFFF